MATGALNAVAIAGSVGRYASVASGCSIDSVAISATTWPVRHGAACTALLVIA